MNATANKPSILYLEDDPEWAKRIQSYLGERYDITIVRCVNDALDLVREQSFALLLLDISLVIGDSGDERGLQFIEQIRNMETIHRTAGDQVSRTKIVILTAYPWRRRIIQSFRDYQVSDFLDKGDTSRADVVKVVDAAIKSM